MDTKELFEKATQWASTKVASVGRDQLDKDTPCEEWDVKAVANHMLSGVKMVGDAAQGQEPDASIMSEDLVGDDPGRAYTAAVQDAVSNLKDAQLEGTWKLPFGEMPPQMAVSIFAVDQIVHAWDIAKATGQDASIPDHLASAAHGIVGGNITDDRRGDGKFFGPEVKVPDGASQGEKLLGYLGRDPT